MTSIRGDSLFETTSNYLKAGLRLAERFLVVAIVMSSPVLRMMTPCFLKWFSHLFNTMHAERQVFSKVFSRRFYQTVFSYSYSSSYFSHTYTLSEIFAKATKPMKLINYIVKTKLSIMEIVYYIYHCTEAYTGLHCSQGSR